MSGQRRSSTSIEPPRAELTSGTVMGGDAAQHQLHSRVTPIWRRTARTRDRLPLGDRRAGVGSQRATSPFEAPPIRP